jgi:hypothetical protein
VFADLDDANHGYFAITVTNVAKVQELLEWVQREEGIRKASVEILQDLIPLQVHRRKSRGNASGTTCKNFTSKGGA